jgi:hypothetical protein
MGPRTTGKRGGARLLLDAFDACISFHEPPHGAPSDVEAFARQLPPDLANAIDAEVLLEHAPDVDRQLAISLRPPRQATRIGFPAGVFVPGCTDFSGLDTAVSTLCRVIGDAYSSYAKVTPVISSCLQENLGGPIGGDPEGDGRCPTFQN